MKLQTSFLNYLSLHLHMLIFDIEQDYLKAYAWAGVDAARGFKPAEEIRDKIEGKFTSEQLIEARLLAKNFWNLHVKE